MSKIKFIALSGQDERDKYLYALDIYGDIFILDAGLKYPKNSSQGIEFIIPKLDFIIKNKNKIKGIFLTNNDLSNCGSVGYILKETNVPIYCNKITELVLRDRLKMMKLPNNFKFNIINDKNQIKLGNTEIEILKTTSSSPSANGFIFHTELGAIVYMGNYIIEGRDKQLFTTDYKRILKISNNKVLAFISDSEYASRKDFTSPNHIITNHIESYFKNKNRLIFGLFEEDIYKLTEICTLAKKTNRKIIFSDNFFENIVRSGLIGNVIDESQITDIKSFNKIDDCILVISGSKNNLYLQLEKIALEEDNLIKIKEKDTIILAVALISGVEKKHAKLLDSLARTDGNIVAISDKNVWNINASYEDIKMMCALLKPKYFIPVRGLYKDLLSAEKAAIETGIESENIGIIENGQSIILSAKRLALENEKIEVGNSFIDRISTGEINSLVINERKQLSSEGVIIIATTLDMRNKKIVSNIDVQIRGIVDFDNKNEIIKQISEKAIELLDEGSKNFIKNQDAYDLNDIKKDIVLFARAIIKKNISKMPIILVIINEFYNTNINSNSNKNCK